MLIQVCVHLAVFYLLFQFTMFCVGSESNSLQYSEKTEDVSDYYLLLCGMEGVFFGQLVYVMIGCEWKYGLNFFVSTGIYHH